MVVGDFAIETETLVVGAGPGGYVAAIRAAQLGQKVTIVEKGNLGGVCLNVGCIPSKALISASHRYVEAKHSEDIGIKAENVTVDFSKVQQWKASVVKKLTSGVEGLLKGTKSKSFAVKRILLMQIQCASSMEIARKHIRLKTRLLQQALARSNFLALNFPIACLIPQARSVCRKFQNRLS